MGVIRFDDAILVLRRVIIVDPKVGVQQIRSVYSSVGEVRQIVVLAQNAFVDLIGQIIFLIRRVEEILLDRINICPGRGVTRDVRKVCIIDFTSRPV